MDATYDTILKLEKKRVCARMDKNKPIKNIANFGIKKNCNAKVERNGEYFGLTIQALEDVKPIITNYRMANAFKQLEHGDLSGAQFTLCLNNPNEVYYVMEKWLSKYGFTVPEFITKNYTKIDKKEIDCEELDKFISIERSYAIPCKLKIVDIGLAKNKQPVVPEDWIGKTFKSASDLHKQMGELDTRKDKPAVHYCCTYGMMIKDKIVWKNKSEYLNDIIQPIFGIIIATDNTIKFTNFVNKQSFGTWHKQLQPQMDIIVTENSKLVIACDKNSIFNDNPEYIQSLNVGVLVSQLQKCIRRGSTCSKLLCETLRQLNLCKPYNLPEHNFMRVSGSKQLLWRLYISTVEDSSIYNCDGSLCSLDYIFVLALICHIDGNLQLKDTIMEKIIKTALIIQSHKVAWKWRCGKPTEIEPTYGENKIINSMKCALYFMPMMSGDRNMLTRAINYIDSGFEIPQFKYDENIETELLDSSIKEYEYECKCESIDMHCYPNIILLTQASLPFVINGEFKTYDIPRLIWDNLSKKSFRYEPNEIKNAKLSDMISTVSTIQTYMQKNEMKNFDNYTKYDDYLNNIIHKTTDHDQISDQDIDIFTKRLAFLLIFGKKMHMAGFGKYKSCEIIIGGDIQTPIKIKKVSTKNKHEFLVGDERFQYETQFLKTLEQPIKVILQNAPNGYKWKFEQKGKVYIQINLDSTDSVNMRNNISFYVDGEKVEPFDGSNLLIKIPCVEETKHDQLIDKIIRQSMYLDSYLCDHFTINVLMRHIWLLRNKRNDNVLYKWSHYVKHSEISECVWRMIYSRLISMDSIQIGPVDRSGNKTLNAISYEYEGVLWRLMNLLAMLYPETIIIRGTFKFDINKNTSGYCHLLKVLQNTSIEEVDATVKPQIVTHLWEHQTLSSEKIIDGIFVQKKNGHCDASCVGSGKTLVALAVIAKLMNLDKNDGSSGALILLPTEKLYNTWINEINAHTKDFKTHIQHANGTISFPTETKKQTGEKIEHNSILITTLGRMRDHPIVHKWLYVIVDECLSVQNSSSLHTGEAWRQVTNSKYGVLLLSASFFRSRFDKLLYMLRMLRTGLPEDIEYLDTLLNECLVCYIAENTRKWVTSVNNFTLPKTIRDKYDAILQSSDDYESKYIKLNKLMYDECDYIKCFKNIIDKIESDETNKNRRALIYARSKKEADMIAENIKGVSRYSTTINGFENGSTGKENKKLRHVVLSYAEGTYGLNDLVIYDTLITRPPDADKLPQMKGRLDRPNQKNNILSMEYLLFENTVEDAMLYKLEMSKKFHGQYILPLAEFYKLAIELHKK